MNGGRAEVVVTVVSSLVVWVMVVSPRGGRRSGGRHRSLSSATISGECPSGGGVGEDRLDAALRCHLCSGRLGNGRVGASRIYHGFQWTSRWSSQRLLSSYSSLWLLGGDRLRDIVSMLIVSVAGSAVCSLRNGRRSGSRLGGGSLGASKPKTVTKRQDDCAV